MPSILDYIPVVNLFASLAMIMGGYFMLKLALSSFQTSLVEVKEELTGLASEVKAGLAEIQAKFEALGNRVTALETVSAMLGRKPH